MTSPRDGRVICLLLVAASMGASSCGNSDSSGKLSRATLARLEAPP